MLFYLILLLSASFMSEPFFRSRSADVLCAGSLQDVAATLEKVQDLGNSLLNNSVNADSTLLRTILIVPFATFASALADGTRADALKQEGEIN
jgi:hypothetical protein